MRGRTNARGDRVLAVRRFRSARSADERSSSRRGTETGATPDGREDVVGDRAARPPTPRVRPSTVENFSEDRSEQGVTYRTGGENRGVHPQVWNEHRMPGGSSGVASSFRRESITRRRESTVGVTRSAPVRSNAEFSGLRASPGSLPLHPYTCNVCVLYPETEEIRSYDAKKHV